MNTHLFTLNIGRLNIFALGWIGYPFGSKARAYKLGSHSIRAVLLTTWAESWKSSQALVTSLVRLIKYLCARLKSSESFDGLKRKI